MKKSKYGIGVYAFTAFACVVIIAMASVITYQLLHDDDPDDQWDAFADKANAYTDHALANGNYHKPGDIIHIDWNDTSCSINGMNITASYRFSHIDYSYPTSYTSEYESLTYGYVFADDDCLRIEWHSWSKSDVVYPSDPSKDTHVVNEDHVIRTQYIPYSSITNMTVYEVIE